jgi:AcrR family transcriptional regulator
MPSTPKANRGPSAGPENRRALIAAARDGRERCREARFGEHLARRAGVGQGSLYRHFPDRLSLAVAVFDDNIAELEVLVADDDATVSTLFDALTEQALASTALVEVMTTHRHDPLAEPLRTRATAIVEALLVRDQAAGRIADHVETEDVLLAIAMLAVLLSRTDERDRPDVATRGRRLFRAAFALPG